ncbi:hypothetical protein B0T17DRAFT_592806 [Bombardia bombarda]|uniref:Heterokaryon incompatibility domain-containing protein n=1 Tax=Bombardia bombarda TaxID=252184 RepID=A0AA40BV92_9PEZI|nr:hypothetical protein B0T17DRAFT_592806 [Bombardia bombarda]
MRLLRTDTLEPVEFVGRVPPYELSLPSRNTASVKRKAGYAKIVGCCARAREDGYEYAWVDTCCIDKTSSAELSEAINSMYRWYQEAHICYAYIKSSGPIPSLLRDYDKLPRTFENSRCFMLTTWREIGTKFSLRTTINRVTGIDDIKVLEGADPSTCHVAERMSWAANRETTRTEDAAYCLLGIFKVHMPLIYGEGRRAPSSFLSNKHHWKGQRRNSPADSRTRSSSSSSSSSSSENEDTPPLMTSRGLRVSLLTRQSKGEIHAYLNCKAAKPGVDGPSSPVCLILRRQDCKCLHGLRRSQRRICSARQRQGPGTVPAQDHIYLSAVTVDSAIDRLHNHRMNNSLDKDLYMLEKPNHTVRTWKVTSPFSHAVGVGKGHSLYEVPRKSTQATLFQPFELPPFTVRIFAFEPPPQASPVTAEPFAIVVGNGWCDIVAISDADFVAKWGLLVRDGRWNDVFVFKYISHAAQVPLHNASQAGSEGAVDRLLRRVGDLTVSVALKKVRKDDINCESAIKIVWAVR